MMRKVFLGLVGGLLVYEAVALANECEGDTISEIMWTATTKRPLVPFAAGLLCGHFFWQRVPSPAPAPPRELL
jgi:hypothetical protein